MTEPDPLPIVVRVDEVGRAEVVDYDAGRATASMDDPVIPFFLTQFVHDHYSRRRTLGTDNWRRSLFFLRQDVAREVVERERARLVAFLSNNDLPDRLVDGLEIRMIPQPEPPYVAELFFDLVESSFGAELTRESVAVSIRFVFAEELDADTVLVNPLGLVIVFLEQQAVFAR